MKRKSPRSLDDQLIDVVLVRLRLMEDRVMELMCELHNMNRTKEPSTMHPKPPMPFHVKELVSEIEHRHAHFGEINTPYFVSRILKEIESHYAKEPS